MVYKRAILMAWSVLALSFTGCLSPVHVRSARPLADGENEITAGISGAYAARAGVSWYNGTDVATQKAASGQGLGNPIPEVAFRRGVGGDFDVGARVGGGSGLVELDTNYRFLQRDTPLGKLHVASGLQLGQLLASSVRSGRAVVPVRATLDVLEMLGGTLGATLSVHGGYRWVSPGPVAANSPPDKIDDLRWTLGRSGATFGGGVLVDWRDDAWTVGLGCDVAHWTGEIGAPGRDLSSYGVTAVQGVLTGAWRWGKDAAKLRKAAEDLDSLTKPR